MNMSKKLKLTDNERGFASVVIALVMITVLALVTVGFAQLARREQQSALDKQLSSQAYYAAETAINDAIKEIKAGTLGTPDPNDCTPASLAAPKNTISAANNVTYSCVLINTTPETLVWDNVDPGDDRVVTFDSGAVLNNLTVQWGSVGGRTAFRNGVSGFTPLAGWNSPAVLQFSLTPLRSMERDSLINNTFNFYMYPSSGGDGTITVGEGVRAPIESGNCSGSGDYTCSVTITGLGGLGATRYAVRFIDFYDASKVLLKGTDTGGLAVKFSKAQAVIDATGKAKDVLKRLQVRVPLEARPDLPPYVIQAQNTCKRLETTPGSPGTSFVGVGGGPATGNDPCNLAN